MAIDNSKIIDFIGVNEKHREVILTIADHLDWQLFDQHLTLLELKLNSYIAFIESGEIYGQYPAATGKHIVIEIVGKYPLPIEANDFFDHLNLILIDVGAIIRFKQQKEVKPS